MVIVAFLLAFLLATCVLFFVVRRVRRQSKLTMLDWTLLAIGGFYGLGWAGVVLLFGAIDGYYWEPWLKGTESIWPLYPILSLLLISGIVFGWRLSSKRRRPSKSIVLKSSKIAWVLLGLAVVAQVLYARAYGGLWALTQDYTALSIRSGISETSNPLSFLQPFGLLSAMATILFFGMFLEKKEAKTLTGLVISAAFSVYVYFTLFGRLDFLLFSLSLPLGYSIFAGVSAVSLVARGAFVMAAVIGLAFALSAYFEIKSHTSMSVFFFNELSFPYANFVSLIEAAKVDFYFFRDLLFLPAYLLPSSLYSQYLPLVSGQNTFLVLGAERGPGGLTGGIPVDLISLGYYQLGIAGVPLMGIVWGVGLRKLQNLLDRIEPSGIKATLTAYISMKIAVFGVLYAQPEHIITRNFALITVLVLIWLGSRVKGGALNY